MLNDKEGKGEVVNVDDCDRFRQTLDTLVAKLEAMARGRLTGGSQSSRPAAAVGPGEAPKQTRSDQDAEDKAMEDMDLWEQDAEPRYAEFLEGWIRRFASTEELLDQHKRSAKELDRSPSVSRRTTSQ